jgi:hypothetical protein
MLSRASSLVYGRSISASPVVVASLSFLIEMVSYRDEARRIAVNIS